MLSYISQYKVPRCDCKYRHIEWFIYLFDNFNAEVLIKIAVSV